MKRLSFLLLDANVVIHLFKCGLWEQLVVACDLHLARTVVQEAHFYEDDQGQRHDFDLGPYERAGSITVFEVPLSDVTKFRSSFDAGYFEKLDAGEAESLARLLGGPEDMRICSADAIVFRVLGNLDKREQGLSLEEVLKQVGLSRTLPWPLTKRFRERWTKQGFEEQLHGLGSKQRS